MANRKKDRGAGNEAVAEESVTLPTSESEPTEVPSSDLSFPLTGGDPLVQPEDGPEVPPEHLLDHVDLPILTADSLEKLQLDTVPGLGDTAPHLASTSVGLASESEPTKAPVNLPHLDEIRACFAYERMCREEGLDFPRWFDQDQATRDAFVTTLRHHDEGGETEGNLFCRYID